MPQIKILIIFLIINLTTCLQAVKLSPNAKVSVLTCNSGEELYSAFGHSAIHIYDNINNIDLTFNYGTFDFSTPNFYLKFANGDLNYLLSAGKYKYFIPEYVKEKRSVFEQTLNISQHDKQAIFNALLKNYKPENRYYKYDFFFDNCATRVYDIITANLSNEIVLANYKEQRTYREYLHTYLTNSPWIKTGLDLILGMGADKKASTKQSTYLPNYLMLALDNAHLSNGKKLVAQKETLLDFSKYPKSKASLMSPILLLWLLLALGISLSLAEIRLKIKLSWFDNTLYIISGLIGIFMCYMWFISHHKIPEDNLNVLWAIPFAILIPLLGKNSLLQKILLWYEVLSLTIFVLGWFILPQHFPVATLPFAILMLIRTSFIIKRKNTHYIPSK